MGATREGVSREGVGVQGQLGLCFSLWKGLPSPSQRERGDESGSQDGQPGTRAPALFAAVLFFQ